MRRVCSTSSSALRCSIFFIARSAIGLFNTRSSSIWKLGGGINISRFPKALLNCGEELSHSSASRLRADIKSRCACSYSIRVVDSPTLTLVSSIGATFPPCTRSVTLLTTFCATCRVSSASLSRSCAASTSVYTLATLAIISTRRIS